MQPHDPLDSVTRPDTTSMIDVVFLMIVFFVCLDFRVLEAKVPAWLPRDHGGKSVVEPAEVLAVKVHIAAMGTPTYPPGMTASSIDPATGRPARFILAGHRARWQVGPRPLADEHAVRDELRRLADDPRSQVPDPATGGRKRMACLVEAFPGACYEDVAKTADMCRAAGFTDVQLCGGLGSVR